MYRINLTLTQTLHGTVTVEPKRANLTLDVEMASPMCATLELIRCAMGLFQKAGKMWMLANWGFKKDYDRCVRFTPIFRVGDYVPWTDVSLPLVCGTVWVRRLYQVIIPYKGAYRVIEVNKNKLRIVQDALANKIYMHRTTSSPTSRRQCNETATENEDPGEEEQRSDGDRN